MGKYPELMKQTYWIEAWALGMFMISACCFTALFELPGMPLREAIASPHVRRWLIGCAMGLTAIGLIYSPWGRRSGALMNPALTLSFWFLGKISRRDAWAYGLSQTVGSAVAMLSLNFLMPGTLAEPSMYYVMTLPGLGGPTGAFAAEVLMSFGMLLMVLYSSNHPRTAPYTGIFAGLLIMLFITFCGPVSGMSINPARSFASAFTAGHFEHLWIYFIAPTLGMLGAAIAWKRWICKKKHFQCSMV